MRLAVTDDSDLLVVLRISSRLLGHPWTRWTVRRATLVAGVCRSGGVNPWLRKSSRGRELLSLRWEDTADGLLTFLETKTGKPRTLPISPTITAILDALPRLTPWVFPSTRTGKPYQSIRKTFERIVDRAETATGDVTLHTLRHTALSRMIAAGFDDYTVVEISGHSTTRMLARYTHPTEQRKVAALESIDVGLVTNWSHNAAENAATDSDIAG